MGNVRIPLPIPFAPSSTSPHQVPDPGHAPSAPLPFGKRPQSPDHTPGNMTVHVLKAGPATCTSEVGQMNKLGSRNKRFSVGGDSVMNASLWKRSV